MNNFNFKLYDFLQGYQDMPKKTTENTTYNFKPISEDYKGKLGKDSKRFMDKYPEEKNTPVLMSYDGSVNEDADLDVGNKVLFSVYQSGPYGKTGTLKKGVIQKYYEKLGQIVNCENDTYTIVVTRYYIVRCLKKNDKLSLQFEDVQFKYIYLAKINTTDSLSRLAHTKSIRILSKEYEKSINLNYKYAKNIVKEMAKIDSKHYDKYKLFLTSKERIDFIYNYHFNKMEELYPERHKIIMDRRNNG